MIQQTVNFLTEPNITQALIVLAITATVYIFKGLFFRNVVSKIINSTSTILDNEIYPLIDRLTSVIIWIVGLLFFLSNLGVNINSLLATLGASSLVVAYGFRDSFTNIISGMSILLYRPFKVGDFIKLPSGERVEVLEIGSGRCKFLDDEQNAVIIISNNDLSKNKIVNFTALEEIKNE